MMLWSWLDQNCLFSCFPNSWTVSPLVSLNGISSRAISSLLVAPSADGTTPSAFCTNRRSFSNSSFARGRILREDPAPSHRAATRTAALTRLSPPASSVRLLVVLLVSYWLLG